MNRQKSLDILQYNKQEAQKNMDKKKFEVINIINKLIIINIIYYYSIV